jgi:hypothetical protein
MDLRTTQNLILGVLMFVLLALGFTAYSNKADAAFDDNIWVERFGSYVEVVWSEGRNVLIKGTSKYLNFGTVSGSSGYGVRDNSGTIQVKNSGGSWSNIAVGGGEANTASNVGTGEGDVFKQKAGVDLEFKTLLAGSGITITNNASDVTIEATGGGTGDMTKATYDTDENDVVDSAEALASNGSNCSAGSAAGGVDASGAAEDCADYEEDLANEAGLYAALSDVSRFWESGDLINAGSIEGNILVNDSVDDDAIDFVDITLADFTNDASFITGNETITLSGDVTGSGATAITTTIASDKVLESMLKAVDTANDEDILTYESTTGDFEWHSSSEIKTAMSLNNVENTAISTWSGSSNIVTLGTIATGVWNGTALGANYVPNHDDLNGFVANEHIDWTQDQGATNIHSGNYTDTNTNAATECGDGEFYNGDGSCDAGYLDADGVDDDTTYTAGDYLTLTATDFDLDVEVITDTKCIYIEDPTADDDFNSIWANKSSGDYTITEIWAESDQTVNFDLQIDDGTPADVNGTDISPAAGEAEDTSLSGDTTLGSDEELDLAITSVSGTPTWVSICWTYTKND